MFATRTADSDRRYESFWHASSPHRTDAWDIERTNADVPDRGQKQHRSRSARTAMEGRMVDGQAKCGHDGTANSCDAPTWIRQVQDFQNTTGNLK
jgi:hypothetical protein